MSSFKGNNIFGSGAHRFSFGRQGYLVTLDYYNGGAGGGSTVQGLVNLDIWVRGRLIAASEPALWALRDAIRDELTATPVVGTLIDSAGRSWAAMSLLKFTEGDRRDRGRVYSVEYVAQFRAM